MHVVAEGLHARGEARGLGYEVPVAVAAAVLLPAAVDGAFVVSSAKYWSCCRQKIDTPISQLGSKITIMIRSNSRSGTVAAAAIPTHYAVTWFVHEIHVLELVCIIVQLFTANVFV